jgi:hypothetical protein
MKTTMTHNLVIHEQLTNPSNADRPIVIKPTSPLPLNDRLALIDPETLTRYMMGINKISSLNIFPGLNISNLPCDIDGQRFTVSELLSVKDEFVNG